MAKKSTSRKVADKPKKGSKRRRPSKDKTGRKQRQRSKSPNPADDAAGECQVDPKTSSLAPGEVVMPNFAAYSGETSIGERSASSRRALCIGIDNYPSPGDRLSGCVNDAKRWQEWFRSQGFETTLLTDSQATRSGIINAVQPLITNAQPGDVIVIQQSSHGTQLPDRSGDESDRTDEAMVPYDHRQNGYVIDDDLAAVCDLIPDGVNVTFILDLCHSGTMTRAFFGGPSVDDPNIKERFLRPDKEMIEAHERTRQRNATRSVRSPYAERREILFSACRADQTSKETPGRGGHFSMTALNVLQGGISAMKNTDFIDKVRAAGRNLFRNQNPELWSDEGLYDQPFLGPRAVGAGVSVTPGSSTPGTPAPSSSSDETAALLSELENIFNRLKKTTS